MRAVAQPGYQSRHNRSARGRYRVRWIGSPDCRLLQDKAAATWSFKLRPTTDHPRARATSSSTRAACACHNARHAATTSGLRIRASTRAPTQAASPSRRRANAGGRQQPMSAGSTCLPHCRATGMALW